MNKHKNIRKILKNLIGLGFALCGRSRGYMGKYEVFAVWNVPGWLKRLPVFERLCWRAGLIVSWLHPDVDVRSIVHA